MAGGGSAGGPLSGFKVLDFTHVFAGPFCTRTLADLGADVVHIESQSRDTGDRHRASYAHRNKRSLALNLKTEPGHDIALRLADKADIVVENFSSNVMRRLKLDYAALHGRNPGLIFVSLSGYGHSGPRSDWTSMNMNLQAFTGLMLTTGREGDPPTAISNSWNDYIGGMHGVIAILQALAERHETGRGRNLDMSQFECSVATLGPLLMASAASGRPPARLGNRSSRCAPQGVYRCAGQDEWCAIVAQTDEQWRALAVAIGRPELVEDARFTGNAGRLRHHDELDREIEAWTRARPAESAEQALKKSGVPAERMRRAKDVVEARDSGSVYKPVPDWDGPKPLRAASLPFRFSFNQVSPVTAPCKLGEHTREVLRDWLDLSTSDVDALQEQRALF
jgi:crotonobetainyl-CoA:carnitine CoA-transferase CaiB-like acyl-CoA transferase